MHPLLLATALLVADPSTTGTEAAGAGSGTIGVVWHDQATVAADAQQRLAQQLAEAAGVDPEALVLDASARAAVRVALELPRVRAEQGMLWRGQLRDAVAAYRAGQLEQAQEGLADLLERIRSDPVVPGAAAVAWQAHVLRGQLAWAQGDPAGLEAALTAAVALDPEARLTTRQAPPSVVEAYDRLHAAVGAEAAQWPSLSITSGSGEPFAVEIDGVPGQRPVPPGEHLVVVRRPGRAPMGAVVDTSTPLVIPPVEALVEPGLPRSPEAAERICDRARLGWLLLARQREGRVGLQRYTCGEGFGPPWYEQHEGVAPGVRRMLERPPEGMLAAPVLHRSTPWPAVQPLASTQPVVLADRVATSPRRQRLRRALPWLLIGGVIAGAVTVGVVVAGDPGADLLIDGDSFLRR